MATEAYRHWPTTGESFNLALTAVCLASTNVAAFAARLYVLLRHRGELRHLMPTFLLCAVLALASAQSAALITACYYGWGSAISTLPQATLHTAEVSFFASNILLVLALGVSRACIGWTLHQASALTPTSKFAFAILGVIPIWTLGSILGVVLNRTSNGGYWNDISQDCNSALWSGIIFTGLCIDIAVAAHGVKMTLPLSMAREKKVFTIIVFSIGLLVNVPLLYGLSWLYRNSTPIDRDATLNSVNFAIANQAAVAISLWCRVIEAIKKLGRDMGYQTYGNTYGSNSMSYGKSKRSVGSNKLSNGKLSNSKQSRRSASAKEMPSEAEDEIELRPTDGVSRYSANVHSEESKMGNAGNTDGITISREYGYDAHERLSS